ncbi:hypothetical protein Q8A73_011973 [Channa argus]|nr:hypothetical protein Q8A73_011973 [Channa argus]
MSPIKNICLTYEPLNEEGTFSEGDFLYGTVTFTLTKDTKVKTVLVKAKGEANVHWTEKSGNDERSYSARKRYFKVKENFVGESAQGTILPKGSHHFKFRLQIPDGNMPSSFKGFHGKIVYMLEAKLSRSRRLPSRDQKQIKFVSKSIPQPDKCPQSGSVNKETGVFSKGEVQISATVSRRICFPGDTLSVVATICNSSSKTTRPKFMAPLILLRKHCKMIGETLTPDSKETVSCQIKIPVDAIYTLYNCDIISVDYFLKVYLDISFAIDPVVLFPLVIVPPSLAASQADEAVGPYPAGAVGAPSYSDLPPPAFPVGPYPAPTGSGTYGYPAPGPNQHMDISGYKNQWAQQATPYGFSTTAFTAPSVQVPAPTVPPLFQQGEEPPSYMSLFPTSQDNLSSSESNYKS